MINELTCLYRLPRFMFVLAALSFSIFGITANETAAQIAQRRVAGPNVELIAEVRMAQPAGGFTFVPATVFEQGQEIDYTVRISNPNAQPLDEVTVVQRLPANTRYVAGSATGAGADVQFSVDGAQNFAKPERLRSLRNAELTAAPAEYTHVRWQLRYALAPHAVVLARFRAVFQ